MKTKILPATAALLLAASPAYSGTFNSIIFTDDFNSGISSSLSYTAVADFLGTGTRSVNGVSFAEAGLSGTNFALSGTTATFPGPRSPNNVTGVSNGLVQDFFYGEAGTASLTLSGLTVGTRYTTSWYNMGFGSPGGRQVNITASDTGTVVLFDQNSSNDGNGNLLFYTYTATAPTITYTFDAVNPSDTFHHYAMTNAVAGFTPVTPVFTDVTASGPGAYSPFTVSNTDLLQTSLAGTSSSGTVGNGNEGTGGIDKLYNGVFSISDIPGNIPELVLGYNGGSVTFTLDTSVNTYGYDISSIANYGGWNDAGRDQQKYSVFYSLVGDSSFSLFGSVDHNSGTASANDPSATSVIFTPDSALANVDAIRIDFLNGVENGYTGYGEFDVVGAASVPEPGSTALLGLGFAALIARRRRNG
jgi:hypothetical protein